MPSNCPLCSHSKVEFLFRQKQFERHFYHCKNCDLRYVQRDETLSLDSQKSRYEKHDNSVRTTGYEKFLRRLVDPLVEYVDKCSHGLDFGSGPYPMLVEILKEDGYSNVESYDPIFANNKNVILDKKYQFVTCCEVIEHMRSLQDDLDSLFSCVDEGGVLIISTAIVTEAVDFQNWYYILDETHVNFFSLKSFEYICAKAKLALVSVENDLLVLKK